MYLPICFLDERTPIRYPLAVTMLYVLLVVIVAMIGVAGFSFFVEEADELSTALKEALAILENHKDAITQLITMIGSSTGAWLVQVLEGEGVL